MFGYRNNKNGKINPWESGTPREYYFPVEDRDEMYNPGSYYSLLGHIQISGSKRRERPEDDEEGCRCAKKSRK